MNDSFQPSLHSSSALRDRTTRLDPPAQRVMSRAGENAHSGDVTVIQEVRGLAEELTNLRQENTILQGNFDELKTHHTKIQTAYDSLAAQYHELSNEKNEMDAYYKSQIDEWRANLEQKHSEFEEARAQIMQPRELDLLRKKLMEEIENPTRQKLHAYELEIEEGAEKFTQAVRDLETLRTHHDVEVAKLLKDAEYAKMDFNGEITMLRKELSLVEESLAMKSRENDSYHGLSHELSIVQARCEALSVETEAKTKQYNEALTETEKLKANLKVHSSVTEKLERRIHVLQGEVEARDSENARQKNLVIDGENNCNDLQRRLDETNFKHRADMKLFETRAAKDRAELEHEFAIEREEAEEKEQAILSRLATHDQSIKNIQDVCDQKVYLAEDRARDARRAAEAGKIDAEVKLDAALTELAGCKSDMLKAVGEAEGLRAALSVMEREYANEVPAMRADLQQTKKDLEHEHVRMADLRNTIEVERVERVEVGASLIERDREVRRLLAELERKDLKSQNEIATMKKAWQKEKIALINRAKDIASTMEERHRNSMRKARRKIDNAQRKVVGLAHDKVTLLESTVPTDVGGSSAEEREEQSGGTSLSVLEQELAALRGRQDTYDRSVANSSLE